MSNVEAAQSGDRRKALEQLRDTLAGDLDVADPNVRAQLAGQYRACLAELAALPVAQRSTLDDLAARRAERKGAVVAPAKKGRKANV